MTSRKTEEGHKELLEKLLIDSGLECVMSPLESLESSTTTVISEEPAPEPEEEVRLVQEAVIVEEEIKPPVAEEVHEELPVIFPTPSLRHVLPDKIRAIEKQNRIYVLPDHFKRVIDPLEIPKIAYMSQQKYIDTLADLLGCKKYKTSLAEFWFLDTLANLLRRAQEDEMGRSTQVILMLWFCEWIKEIQHFDAADRNRMMERFQHNMLAAVKVLVDEDRLPAPADAGVFYKDPDDVDGGETLTSLSQTSRHLVTFPVAAYECSLRDITRIIHYIFDLFSTDYQYNLVRSVFTFTPEYNLVDAPYQIQAPKRLYNPVKLKQKKDKSPNKDKLAIKKKKDTENEEYQALMELKAKEEKYLEEQEEKDRELWDRKSHILPLNLAATDEFFNKFWPSARQEIEFVTSPEIKGKGKGKGKK